MTDAPHDPSVFRFPLRVYYEDTDAAGIVYHANHVKFAERARTELLRALGYDHKGVRDDFGLTLIVKAITIDYKAVAKLDDLLEVRTNLIKFGNSSFTLAQNIWRSEVMLASLDVVLVAVNAEGRPERLPPKLRELFTTGTAPEPVLPTLS